MQRSNSSSERPAPSGLQTLGCTPRSGVSLASKAPECLEFEEKILDEAQLQHHLNKLVTLGEELVVTLKMTPHSPVEHVSLEALVAPLVENRAFGGQVEYIYWGQRWLDTFIAGRAGVRLVRLQLSA